MNGIKKYFSYFKKVAVPIALEFFLIGVGLFLILLQPLINKIVYDDLFSTYDEQLLYSVVYGLVAIFSFLMVINFITEIMSSHIYGKLIVLMRGDVSKRLMHLKLEVIKRLGTGAIVHKVIPQIDILSNTLTSLIKAAAYIFQIIIILIATLILDVHFFIVFTAVVVGYAIWYGVLKKPIARYTKKEQNVRGQLYTLFYEHIQNSKTIKTLGMYNYSEKQLLNALQKEEKYALLNTFFRSMLSIATKSIDLVILIIAGISFYRINAGEMTVGFFLVFTTLMYHLKTPVTYLVEMENSLQSGIAAARQIECILNGEAESSGINVVDGDDANIEFRNVSVCYEGTIKVLSAVSFTIEAGSVAAFVGASGSGKSTIVHLLTRLYDGNGGNIYLGNKEIQSYDIVSLRDKVYVLSQDFFIFNDSVRNNIDPASMYSPGVINKTLEMSGLAEFICRLDYHVGENGCNLSGGERQRLALARILIRKPLVLILDEATSNVDPGTENVIISNVNLLRKSNKHMSIIMVTHRVQYLSLAEKVLFIDGGGVADSGMHADLMKRNQHYNNVLYTLNKMSDDENDS